MRKLWQGGWYALALVALLSISVVPVPAAEPVTPQASDGNDPNVTVDPSLFNTLRYRPNGFSRGGRATAVTGIPSQPLTFFFGSAGGGVWKTTDAGINWTNISDGFFGVGSIGDIKVADSDPNVIYVGTGSGCPRGNISVGDGIYKSTDGGKTWEHKGLPQAGQIPEIAIHPQNPDLVYVAALGHIFGANEERGIYRSKDGGESWEKVLFVSDRTGFYDVAMNPRNPREIYAAAWTVERKPWTIDSGSEEGGIWKTTDGGDTWKKLTGGLPTGIVGKIDVTVSPPNPDRAWALVEAPGDRGGVYRTEDAGKTWQKVNGQRKLLQRAWYYIHIFADPVDPDTVYSLNTGFYKSTDGGKTFDTQFRPPHGDNHDLWLNPNNPDYLVNSNDGGADVSLTGGTSFSDQMSQPTAQFYRVTVDNRFPYRIYGAQQDNSTASVASRGVGGFGGRGAPSFYSVGGGESGHIAVDPRNPDIVYAGSYGGSISRMDTSSRQSRNIRVYADSQTGQQALDMKYRFQWNAPIRISPHDPDVVYVTSQYVHRTRDGGQSWEVISPDLTRDDKTKQGYSGGEGITRDNTGVEVYDTVFAFEESPITPGLLWTGSDDGLVHISRDNGATWTDITPPGMPDFGTVNVIDLSAHDPGRATVAVYRYRRDDFHPYVFQTNDYGAHWKSLTDGTNGIPADHSVRVVREDPDRQGLLYAGTEFGMYISFDNGGHWQSFQLNLPVVPVTDLVIKDKDLVVATQGRAFWVLEDLSPLHQITDEVAASRHHLFKPRDAYRAGGFNPTIFYYLAESPSEPVKIEILDGNGDVVQSRTGRPGEEKQGPELPPGVPRQFAAQFFARFGGGGGRGLSTKPGLNRFTWNGRYPSIYTVPRGTVQWGGGGGQGPKAVPGTYQVRMTIGDWSQTESFEYRRDPRLETTPAQYDEQLRFAREVGAAAKKLYDALQELRDVKEQATDIARWLRKAGHGNKPGQAARAMNKKLTAVEGELTQLEGEGGQDALNFPGRLDNQFNALYSNVSGPDTPVPAGAQERWRDLEPQLQPLLDRIQQVYDTDLAAFNELIGGMGAGPVIMPGPGASAAASR
ncbi:MAG: WD40/YVTN/BNR-like repeat-containing protein [Acidobacteriota bacterium]